MRPDWKAISLTLAIVVAVLVFAMYGIVTRNRSSEPVSAICNGGCVAEGRGPYEQQQEFVCLKSHLGTMGATPLDTHQFNIVPGTVEICDAYAIGGENFTAPDPGKGNCQQYHPEVMLVAFEGEPTRRPANVYVCDFYANVPLEHGGHAADGGDLIHNQ